MIRISVIITSYNQKDLLLRAVESVLAQELPPDEILICDDASPDGSRDVLQSLGHTHPAIKVVLQETNQGVSRNRNTGIAQAQGEYITWLDGDDLFTPIKLAREVGLLEANNTAGWAYSQVTTCFTETDETFRRYTDPPQGRVLDKVLFMLGRAPRNPTVRAAALGKTGGFNPDMNMYEDFDLLARLAKHYPCCYCPESGMVYMVHGQGTHRAKAQEHIRNLRLLEKNVLALLTDPDETRLGKDFQRYLAGYTRRFLGRIHLAAMNVSKNQGDRLTAAFSLLKAALHGASVISPGDAARELRHILFGPLP